MKRLAGMLVGLVVFTVVLSVLLDVVAAHATLLMGVAVVVAVLLVLARPFRQRIHY